MYTVYCYCLFLEHMNCFKANSRKTSERQSGSSAYALSVAHRYLLELICPAQRKKRTDLTCSLFCFIFNFYFECWGKSWIDLFFLFVSFFVCRCVECVGQRVEPQQ